MILYCSLLPLISTHCQHSIPLPQVVLSRQQRRVQLMRIKQREERLKKEKENKKKKKRQNQKTVLKQKAHTHHHQQQYYHPAASHPHQQTQSSQPPKLPPSQTEPGYHRKPNSKRRFDGDVLSPVRWRNHYFSKMKMNKDWGNLQSRPEIFE